MLEALGFQDVGPAANLKIAFRERLNFLVGDNGLGKTFLLDAAWWSLTRTWARRIPLMPHHPPSHPRISYRFGAKGGWSHEYESNFDWGNEEWSVRRGRPPIPGLVLYAQVDGGFSIWDPARNYWRGKNAQRQPAFRFAAEEVWNGLPLGKPDKHCNGLIADWAT